MDLFTIAILAVSVVCLIVSLMVFIRIRAMEEKTAKKLYRLAEIAVRYCTTICRSARSLCRRLGN